MTFPALLRKLSPLTSPGCFPSPALSCSQAPSPVLCLASALPLHLSELSRVHLLTHLPAPWQDWSVGFPRLVLLHSSGLSPVRFRAHLLAPSQAPMGFLRLALLPWLGISLARSQAHLPVLSRVPSPESGP